MCIVIIVLVTDARMTEPRSMQRFGTGSLHSKGVNEAPVSPVMCVVFFVPHVFAHL